jgi:hypothetical protein
MLHRAISLTNTGDEPEPVVLLQRKKDTALAEWRELFAAWH